MNLVVLKECVLDLLAAPIVYPVTAPGLALDTIQSRLKLKYVPGEISYTKVNVENGTYRLYNHMNRFVVTVKS